MEKLGSIISDLERQRDAITQAISALRAVDGTSGPKQDGVRALPAARYAAPSTSQSNGQGGKRHLTPEGRANLSRAMRKRWKQAKRAGKASL